MDALAVVRWILGAGSAIIGIMLKTKHHLFALEYLKDLNAAQAAIRAGYSKKTAKQQGQRLLTNADLKEFIDAELKARQIRTKITADRVLAELHRLATVDIGGAFNDDGSVKELSEMDEDVRRAITGIEVIEYFEGCGPEREQVGVIKKIRMASKEKTLELLAKHLELLTEKFKHDLGEDLAEVIAESFGRPRPPKDKGK